MYYHVTFWVINCILDPAFLTLLPCCVRFMWESGSEQLLFITNDQLVSFLWPTPQLDTLCTWPCPTSSELLSGHVATACWMTLSLETRAMIIGLW